MKAAAIINLSLIIFLMAAMILFFPKPLQAQRMGHGGGGRGGGGGGGGGNRSINGGSRTSSGRPPSNNVSNRQASGSRDMNSGN
ncbi:MAG: hypothetical protein WCK84_12870, partial [Bacteroidota bacterium]